MSSYVEKVTIWDAARMAPVDVQAHLSSRVTVKPSGPVTAGGNTPDIDVSLAIEMIMFVDVTAVSGTSPTMDLFIESRDPVSGKYFVIDSITGITGVSQHVRRLTNFGDTIRVRWVLGGTSPSFTFSIGAVLKA